MYSEKVKIKRLKWQHYLWNTKYVSTYLVNLHFQSISENYSSEMKVLKDLIIKHDYK